MPCRMIFLLLLSAVLIARYHVSLFALLIFVYFCSVLQVETYHVADRGDSENVHRLNKKQLAERRVVHIDIANDPVSRNALTHLRRYIYARCFA